MVARLTSVFQGHCWACTTADSESGTALTRSTKKIFFPVYTFRPQFPHYMAKAIDSSTSIKTKRRWVMNSPKRSIGMKYAALAVLAVALGTSLASAQDVEGKFKLPFTARWGDLVLTPAQYSFLYTQTTSGDAFVVLQREGRNLGVILVGAGASSKGQFSESSLTAVQVGSTYRITSLQLSDPGMNVRFRIHKGEVLEASQTTRPGRDVPVLQAAK
jgi:hypothetical protein